MEAKSCKKMEAKSCKKMEAKSCKKMEAKRRMQRHESKVMQRDAKSCKDMDVLDRERKRAREMEQDACRTRAPHAACMHRMLLSAFTQVQKDGEIQMGREAGGRWALGLGRGRGGERDL